MLFQMKRKELTRIVQIIRYAMDVIPFLSHSVFFAFHKHWTFLNILTSSLPIYHHHSMSVHHKCVYWRFLHPGPSWEPLEVTGTNSLVHISLPSTTESHHLQCSVSRVLELAECVYHNANSSFCLEIFIYRLTSTKYLSILNQTLYIPQIPLQF